MSTRLLVAVKHQTNVMLESDTGLGQNDGPFADPESPIRF